MFHFSPIPGGGAAPGACRLDAGGRRATSAVKRSSEVLAGLSRWSDTAWIGLFFAIALAIRLGLLGLHHAEYTDGLLAVFQIEGAQGFWPPLYRWLSALVGFGVPSEGSARVVSALAGAAVVAPIYGLALEVAGRSDRQTARLAAVLACCWYLLSPMALRWGARVMTDSLFAFLFATAVWAACAAWSRRRAGTFLPDYFLALATVCAALALLTRYQGAFLIPLVAGAIGAVYLAWRAQGKGAMITTWMAQAVWLIPLVWILGRGDQLQAHGGQITDRMGGHIGTALVQYWNVFESFVLLSPYFFTYGIFAFAVGGLVLSRQAMLKGMALYLALALLALQSVFQSFQSRYLLPLLPLVVAYAGLGAARALREGGGKRRWPAVVAIAALYAWTMSLGVVYGQRGTFGDIRQAALLIQEMAPAPVPVFSNEAYGPQRIPIKMRFWSGRQDIAFWMGPYGEGADALPAGAIVCIHSLYGPEATAVVERYLIDHYEVDRVQVFEDSIIPLLPDVMASPESHQNPMGWVLRYTPQPFRTSVYRVTQRKR